MAKVALFKTLVKMMAKQFWIKLTKVPRRVSNPQMVLKKIFNIYFFLRNTYRYDLYVMQSGRRLFDLLAQQGVKDVSLYGTGEIAEMLYNLSAERSVKVKSIYDDFGNNKFLGFNVLPIEAGANNEEKIIVAAVAGIEEKIARLMKLGVGRERIVVLQ